MEIDIVIEEKIGGHSILVGIECTAGKRKATIEWYREMRAKHADLPIAKTVLVSESGFTGQVYKKAPKDNITLMTLGEAQVFEWESLFAKLKGGTIADVRFVLQQISLKLVTTLDGRSSLQIDPLVVLKGPGIEAPLGNLVIEVAKRAGLTRTIMSNLGAVMKKSDHFHFTFRVPEGAHIILDDKSIEVTEITATMSIHPRYMPVEWHSVDFNGQAVATGTFPADFLFPGAAGDTVVTISQEPDNSMKMSLLDSSDMDIQFDVFPHALWQEGADNDSSS